MMKNSLKTLFAFIFITIFTGGFASAQDTNTAEGIDAGASFTTGRYNNTFGYNSGHNTNSGWYNDFYGSYSGYKNTTGSFNLFFGSHAGFNNISGSKNIFIGRASGYNNTDGDYNVFIGKEAGNKNVNGWFNTYIGSRSGYNALGHRNVYIGYQAGYNATGNNKLYISNKANSTLIYGDFSENYVGIAIDVDDVVNQDKYGLYVGKGILCQGLKIARILTSDWSDFVFHENYMRNSIEAVDNFIKIHGHLPNVPSAQEVSENGIDIAKMDATLLRQIEELWLHVIDINAEIKSLRAENDALKSATNE